MKEPLANKAFEPPRNKGRERFPKRVGNRLIGDRKLTPQEQEERNREREAMARARRVRRRLRRER